MKRVWRMITGERSDGLLLALVMLLASACTPGAGTAAPREALVKGLACATPGRCRLATLHARSKLYVDAPHWASLVPEPFDRSTLIQTAYVDGWATADPLVTFELSRPALVSVGCPPWMPMPRWLGDWRAGGERDGLVVEGPPNPDGEDGSIFALFTRAFGAGPVRLGPVGWVPGNEAQRTGMPGMYFVLVREAP